MGVLGRREASKLRISRASFWLFSSAPVDVSVSKVLLVGGLMGNVFSPLLRTADEGRTNCRRGDDDLDMCKSRVGGTRKKWSVSIDSVKVHEASCHDN